MADSKLTDIAKNPRTPGAVALAVALGLLVHSVADDDPEREDKLATLGETLKGDDRAQHTKPARAQDLDTKVLHDEMVALLKECGAGCVDIGAGLVEPGGSTPFGVNVPGAVSLVAVEQGDFRCPGRLSEGGLVCVVDPGTWSTSGATCEVRDDVTWCQVTVTNTGDRAQRFVALLRTE